MPGDMRGTSAAGAPSALDDAMREGIARVRRADLLVGIPSFRNAATIGHVARAVVFGLVAVFLVKAAYDYKAYEAIGLDGALGKLYNGAFGSWLLGAVALGLIAFSCFSLVEARYRRI